MFSLHIPLPLKCVLNNKAFFCSPFAEICPWFFCLFSSSSLFLPGHYLLLSTYFLLGITRFHLFPWLLLRIFDRVVIAWHSELAVQVLASQKSEARLLSSKYRKTLYSRRTYVRAKIANASNNVRLNSLYPLSLSRSLARILFLLQQVAGIVAIYSVAREDIYIRLLLTGQSIWTGRTCK